MTEGKLNPKLLTKYVFSDAWFIHLSETKHLRYSPC